MGVRWEYKGVRWEYGSTGVSLFPPWHYVIKNHFVRGDFLPEWCVSFPELFK
jgi:hypothetical protein